MDSAWAQPAAIKRGQAVNHVRLIDDNRQVTVYVNEELVTTFPYDTVPPGCPVFFVGTSGEAGAECARKVLTCLERNVKDEGGVCGAGG